MILLTLGAPIEVSSWASVPEGLTVVDVDVAEPGYTVTCRMFAGSAEVGRASNSWDSRAAAEAGRWLVSVIGPRHEDIASRRATVLFPERDAQLVSAVVSLLDLDVALVFDEPRYDGTILRLENSARACFVTTASALSAWRGQHVVPASHIDVDDAGALLATLVDDTPPDGPSSTESAVASAGEQQPTRILLVSYFAQPATPVSTIRLGYWHDRLTAIAASEGRTVEVTWLSATRRAVGRPGHIVVSDPGDEAALPHDGVLEALSESGTMRRPGVASSTS